MCAVLYGSFYSMIVVVNINRDSVIFYTFIYSVQMEAMLYNDLHCILFMMFSLCLVCRSCGSQMRQAT